MNRIRSAIFLAVLLACAIGSPIRAQDMGNNGAVLPAFLFSRADQMARANCINNLPNCRADVRDRLELERAVTLIVPWFLLAGALAVLLFYMQRREKQKQAHRRSAKRKHLAGAFKKDDEDEQARESLDRDRDDRFN